VITLAAIILIGGSLALVQLEPVQNIMRNQIVERFNDNYNGTLEIGELNGFIPFHVTVSNVVITDTLEKAGDNTSQSVSAPDTLASADSLSIGVDWTGIYRQKLSINYLTLSHPYINLRKSDDSTSGYTLVRALQKVDRSDNSEPKEGLLTMETLKRLEIIVPELRITNGKLHIDEIPGNFGSKFLPQTIRAENIQLNTFLEIRQEQRFLDIERFNVDLPDLFIEKIDITGQVFDDERFLEFNSFQLETALSELNVTGELDGFNLYERDWKTQLKRADYDLTLDSTIVHTSELVDVLPWLPVYNSPMLFDMNITRERKKLDISRLKMGFNESYVLLYGTITNFLDTDSLTYDLSLDEMQIWQDDLRLIRNREPDNNLLELNTIEGRGDFSGTADKLQGTLDVWTRRDTLRSQFSTSWNDSTKYLLSLQGNNIALGSYTNLDTAGTKISFESTINGKGTDLENITANAETIVRNSSINSIPLQELLINSKLASGFFETDYVLQNDDQTLKGSAWIDLLSAQPLFYLTGNGSKVDLSQYLFYNSVPETALNFSYQVNGQGIYLDDIYGELSVNVKSSVFNGDSVSAHKLSANINSPIDGERILKVESSFADIEMLGAIEPSSVYDYVKYWSEYIKRWYEKEIFFSDSRSRKYSIKGNLKPIDLDYNVAFKNVALLKNYFPSLPSLGIQSIVDGNIYADKKSLQVETQWKDSLLTINNTSVKNLDLNFESELSYGSSLQESARLALQTQFDEVSVGKVKLNDITTDAIMESGQLAFSHSIGKIGKNVKFDIAMEGALNDSSVLLTLQNFYAGNEEYIWQNSGNPKIKYQENQRLSIQDFELRNQEQLFRLNGTYSSQITDSVTYELDNINLSRISDFTTWPFSFSGVLNGSFFTKTLTRQPVVAGDIAVDSVQLDDRIIGDINFLSKYNPAEKRFDTELSIVTDSTKYQQYLTNNNNVGQQIYVDGYFYPPQPGVEQDTVYYFDVDVPEVDMWILPYIVQNVFTAAEGVGDGQGYITGNLSDFDFNSNFSIDSVTVNTEFLNTNYVVRGDLEVDRFSGVNLDSLRVTDFKNGSGILFGNFDFNDFKEEKFFDLWLRLDQLSFLNTSFDRDAPFFGDASGTGLVNLKGSNEGPTLNSVEPITIKRNSTIGVPLLEEITIEENTKSIQFVDDFDNIRNRFKNKEIVTKHDKEVAALEQQEDETRDFTEFFDLNLQFNAPEEINGRLIFDPVTEEILSARGTGRLQVILQDTELSLFGKFEISSGRYNFVSGDIFTRKFRLEEGGVVRWEGDPENARIDVNAVYSARPDVSTVFGTNRGSNDPEDIQRIPVELVLEITGTVESVENDFFFRVPNTLEASQGSRVNDLEARLNQDNNKLLQATSLLLTGELVPVTLNSNQDATSALSSNFRNEGGNVVLSPLLSSQISNLLNNNISNLDFDLNMAGFDQVDLGIALRLFNERLILSREGQIGGTQNDIGNLGATYKLNRAFSIIAFHRQDPTFGTLNSNDAGQSLQSLNGVGLEAQFQFNNWSGFSSTVKQSFRNVFGVSGSNDNDKEKKKNKEDENVAEADSS